MNTVTAIHVENWSMGDTKSISLHFDKMHTSFHLIYGSNVHMYKNVMITLQKEQENPLQISFCFQTREKIAIYVLTHRR
jgi:hypothetical protein